MLLCTSDNDKCVPVVSCVCIGECVSVSFVLFSLMLGLRCLFSPYQRGGSGCLFVLRAQTFSSELEVDVAPELDNFCRRSVSRVSQSVGVGVKSGGRVRWTVAD